MQRILHVAAEAVPLIKTGGLADVAAALPAAQNGLGADARLLLPGYHGVLEQLSKAGTLSPDAIDIGPAFGAARVQLWRAAMPDTALPLLVLDAPWFYGRAGNPYVGANGEPWADNHRRFALLSWVAAQIGAGGLLPDWQPDVVHAHDWHAALALFWLQQHPAAPVRRIFTIHNLAFQGRFSMPQAQTIGIESHWLTPQLLEFHGDLSFMKAGLVGAHQVTTVSPTYAREILRPEFGGGLDGLLRAMSPAPVGVLNGIDERVWNPADDPAIAHAYSLKSLAGKAKNRLALQRECGLAQTRLPGARKPANEPTGPVLGVVSRLSAQKGIDLIIESVPALLAARCQLVVLGSGDRSLQEQLRALADAHPEHIHLSTAFDEALAHRIMAGADAILVPSVFEPCGLTQLYGLRYGTLPIVRRVGGLADTVFDERVDNGGRAANGFVFDQPDEFASTLARVTTVWQDQTRWRSLMRTGMSTELSWRSPAQHYLALY